MDRTSLAAQWLGLRASNTGGTDLISCWETKIPYAAWHGHKKHHTNITNCKRTWGTFFVFFFLWPWPANNPSTIEEADNGHQATVVVFPCRCLNQSPEPWLHLTPRTVTVDAELLVPLNNLTLIKCFLNCLTLSAFPRELKMRNCPTFLYSRCHNSIKQKTLQTCPWFSLTNILSICSQHQRQNCKIQCKINMWGPCTKLIKTFKTATTEH